MTKESWRYKQWIYQKRNYYRTMKNGIRGEIHDGRLAEVSKRGLE